MRNELSPLRAGTAVMPWDDGSSVENAVARVDAFFEFSRKLV